MLRRSDPLIQPDPPQGRQADKLASYTALSALILSGLTTLWFWLGFYETDPGFQPASSAALLALGLGAFAMIPSGFALRFTKASWQEGFRPAYGVWCLVLMLPWIILGILILVYAPIPILFGMIALTLSLIISLWAVISLGLALHEQRERARKP